MSCDSILTSAYLQILALTIDGDVLLLDVDSVLVVLVGVARVGHEAAQGRAVVARLGKQNHLCHLCHLLPNIK